MRSKKQKALRAKNHLFLTISLSTLALILIGIVTYQWILNKKDMDTSSGTNTTVTAVGRWISDNIFKPRPPVTDTDENTGETETPQIAQIALDDKITYAIPSGWTKETGIDYSASTYDVVLKSPDYEAGDTGVGASKGLEIFLSASPLDNRQTLETEKTGAKETFAFSDVLDTKINNIPAIKYHSDADGSVHSLQYFVIKDDYSLLVVISSKDLNAEKSYQSQINSFVSSIRFK